LNKQPTDKDDDRENYEHTPFLDAAELRWSDDLPTSTHYNDRYFSVDDGLEESRYVFIDGANVRGQWQRAQQQKLTDSSIMELGFGSGLNFLATLDAWQHWRNKQPTAPLTSLRYYAIEKHPMRRADLKRTLQRWHRRLPVSQQLIDRFPPRIRGQHRLSFCDDSVELILLFDDVRTAFSELVVSEPFLDAIYLDGFAPARNPVMWNFGVLQRLAELSRPRATLATFSAVGDLRRGLERVGYRVEKRRGFARKREMLVATHYSKAAVRKLRDRKPWYALPIFQRPRRVAIIGAGLAGSTSARALADRGISCTVFDAGQTPASMASSVPVAGWFPQLSLNFDKRSEIYWQACRMLDDKLLLSDYSASDPAHWFDRRGCFFVADTDERQQRLQRIAKRLAEVGLPLSYVGADESSARTGVRLKHAGLDCDLGGSLIPAKLCTEQLQHDRIDIRLAQRATPERSVNGDWQIKHARGIERGFDAVVLATGSDTAIADAWLPGDYDLNHGHVSLLKHSAFADQKRLLCFKGHLTGGLSNDALHVAGATMYRDQPHVVAPGPDTDPNLKQLQGILDDRQFEARSIWSGQRLASRDRLPLLGPVPTDKSVLAAIAASQQSNSMRNFPRLEFESGLFVNLAHGGRGATTAMLSARLLAEIISGQVLCLPRRLVDAFHVARFQIRDARTETVTNTEQSRPSF